MKLKIKEFTIYLDETILVLGFLCLIFERIREYFENYFVCYLFIIFHELAHMCVASIFGVKTTKLSIRISGLNICLKEWKRKDIKWLAIYLAGPISNVILAFVFKNIPMVYTINLALAIINLVPIYPLDGYNILEIVLNIFNIEQKSIIRMQKIAEIMVIIALVILGMYQFVFLRNLSIILMLFYIIIQASNPRNNSGLELYQKCYKNVTNFN